ncbi:hypothetical protein RRG08_007817 [Elysia crispata]|uniref:Homeobox domain-containing protein n=1 Tax=Elysia crispata TaxID=231223 RepID=A0AAE1AEQ7_9GAST|nr:hypothetical protein RRG08_007817 [Elysia crispata]
MEEDFLVGLHGPDRLEFLSWCWRFFQVSGIDICQLHIQVGSYLVDQLAIEGQFNRLRQFISSLTLDEYVILYGNEKFIKAMIRLHMEETNYLNALCLLKNARFEDKDESLVKTWYEIHYKLRELRKGRLLSSVDKCRVRKSHPPPPSICTEEWRPKSKRLPETAIHLLQQWLGQHQKRPYPTRKESEDLARQTDLSVCQVKTWFANARRHKPKWQRKGQTSSRARAVTP